MHDRLSIAHVILFELRAVAHAPQLHQRVAGVGLVLGLHNRRLLVARNQADVRQVGIRHVVQRHQVGASFFERRILLLQHILRRDADVVRHPARAVAEDLVNLGRQLARKRTPPLGALDLRGIPGKLLAITVGQRALVGLEHVRQRHRLTAVLFADALIVRQVDADRRNRAGIAGLDHHVDRFCRHALDVRLAITRIDRQVILEPLRVFGERPDL